MTNDKQAEAGRRNNKRHAGFAGNWVGNPHLAGRSLGRRLHAALRTAHRVLGMGSKRLGLGMLGAGCAIAVLAGGTAYAGPVQVGGGTNTNTGTGDATASGTDAVAVGNGAEASVPTGVAIGSGAVADNATSSLYENAGVAIGEGAHSQSAHSVAIGLATLAGNFVGSATAVGAGAQATGGGSVAIGSSTVYKTVASGLNGTAVGIHAQATGAYSSAFGKDSESIGVSSLASGDRAKATGGKSTALGANSAAANAGDVALGSDSKTAAAVGTTDATIAGTTYNFAGTNPLSTVSVGDVGAERTITNVAAGRLSDASTDAVNGSQLHATNQAVEALNNDALKWDPAANGGAGAYSANHGGTGPNKIANVANGTDPNDAVNVSQLSGALDGLGGGAKVNPDGTVTGPTYNIAGNTYNNVGDALAAEDKLTVKYVPDASGNPTNTVRLSGDGTGSPVAITNVAAGVNDTDAVNYSQVKNNIAYDTNSDGSRGNSLTLVGGASGPVTIHNVAAGILDSDAANVGQVKQARQDAFDYTDAKVANLKDALSGDIGDLRAEARGGIASAMAAAGLRYDDRPGKASVAAALGGFKSSTSIAAGLGYTTEEGDWRLNTAVGYSFNTKDISWNAGMSFTFN